MTWHMIGWLRRFTGLDIGPVVGAWGGLGQVGYGLGGVGAVVGCSDEKFQMPMVAKL